MSTGKLKSHEIEIERLVELGKYTTNAQAVPVTAQILSKKALDPGDCFVCSSSARRI